MYLYIKFQIESNIYKTMNNWNHILYGITSISYHDMILYPNVKFLFSTAIQEYIVLISDFYLHRIDLGYRIAVANHVYYDLKKVLS